MQFCRNRVLNGVLNVFHRQSLTSPVVLDQQTTGSKKSSSKLRAVAAAVLTLSSCMPSTLAAQTPAGSNGPDRDASTLPAAPAPVPTEPFLLKRSARDYSKPYAGFLSPYKWRATSIGKASFENSVRLSDLVKDGKIYLSMSDAIALALENNYDLAIARYNLDIADSDILRTSTGAAPLGVPSGLVTNTLSGNAATTTLTTGGGPGGTTSGAGGAGTGVGGLSLTTAGAGPTPESLDPQVTGTVSFDRNHLPATSFFSTGTSSTNKYNFIFNQGFVTGTNFQFAFNNTYATTNNTVTLYSPQLLSTFNAQITQHLLSGAGIWVNKRYMYQAKNDRRIADATFRQQIIYTVSQVESIYWGLVQAYENVQSKQRALDQSTQLLNDNKKQLEIGTMAPLDIVNAESNQASDQQNLITAQNALNYQQQIIKQESPAT